MNGTEQKNQTQYIYQQSIFLKNKIKLNGAFSFEMIDPRRKKNDIF